MVGELISHYRVIKPLGAGGMGVVYEAEDLSLGRRVALKALPPQLAFDEAKHARFMREAKAVAALNHPNIVTVFGVEKVRGQIYIAMELVEGRTLMAMLSRHGLPLSETLKLGVQLADALAAAHQRGITHRDIKPANIMVTPDSRVKVLDFGLAKLIEDESRHSSAALTASGPATKEGHIVGTVAYMSPEQAQGTTVDSRSDIFSLGIVLYEMATGMRPFTGDTNVAVIVSILKDTPRLASDINTDVPIELARAIRRCLQKDPDQRYQSAKDLRNELAELREESASGDLPSARAARKARPSRFRPLLAGGAVAVSVLAAAALLAGLGWLPLPAAWNGALVRPEPTGGLGVPAQVTSAPGWEAQPVLSPDGSLVAYASNESGNSDIWLVGFRGGSAVRLTDDPATDEKPAWLPDGSAIVFASDRGGGSGIWQVPVLGGSASLLVPDGRDPAISPRGDRITFVRNDAGRAERVFVAPLGNPTAAKRLVDTPAAALLPEDDPSWSPDGTQVCYSADRSLWVVSANGGRPLRLTHDREYDIEPAWAADGKSLYFASYRGGVFALWQVDTSGGQPRRMTRGAGPERHPSVPRDGSRLVFSSFGENMDIVLRDLTGGREGRFGSTRDEMSPVFSHDGRWVVYVVDSGPRGGTELWLQPIDGERPSGPPKLLTDAAGALSHPEFSPDDRWVVFQRTIRGSRDIWIVPVTGGAPNRFTSDPADDVLPIWSPSGTAIAFVSARAGTAKLWMAPVVNGQPDGPARQLSQGPGSHSHPDWSDDGQEVAYLADASSGSEVWVVSVAPPGPARRVTTGAGAGFVRWTAKGKSLLVSGTWGSTGLSIRQVDPKSGESRTLKGLPRLDHPYARPMFDVNRDGTLLTMSDGVWTGDIWVSELTRRRP